ncbi:uncharacterized protein LOC134364357 isoform X1 [Cynocephalus volans]|uniref:uncharacterized protein LOC134364357 isoform X1 n=1 Tax=Cynocephalus volans TaxID=110931 RepID=UPI002FC5E5FC
MIPRCVSESWLPLPSHCESRSSGAGGLGQLVRAQPNSAESRAWVPVPARASPHPRQKRSLPRCGQSVHSAVRPSSLCVRYQNIVIPPKENPRASEQVLSSVPSHLPVTSLLLLRGFSHSGDVTLMDRGVTIRPSVSGLLGLTTFSRFTQVAASVSTCYSFSWRNNTLLYGYSTFCPSSLDGQHLDCVHSLADMNNAASWHVQVFV